MLKFKKIGSNKYAILLDDKKVILYEDVIINYNILCKKEINDEELEIYLSDNNFYECYYLAVSFLNKKMFSEYELEKKLLKRGFNLIDIRKCLVRLKKEGYLDDKRFVNCYINDKINLTNYGPNKIKKELDNLKIDTPLSELVFSVFNSDLINERILKIAEKKIKINRTKSKMLLKKSITNDLINLGYSYESIMDVLSDFEFDDNDIYESEYKKLKNKLCRKFSDDELEFQIKKKLYSKGFKRHDC